MSNTQKTSFQKTPKLYIPSDIYNKIMFWVDKSDYEVSWWGLLDYDKNHNHFIVKEVFLLKQKVGKASTEIDPNAMARLMYQVRESPYKLRWWGHSHVKMGVFWSGTDMDTIKEFSKDGWLLSSVFNQKREVRTSLMLQSPMSIFIDEIETAIIAPEALPEWEQEFEEKVEVHKYTQVSKSDLHSYMEFIENAKKSQKKESEKSKKDEKELDDDQMTFDFYEKNLFGKDGKINEEFVDLFFDDEGMNNGIN